MAVRTVEAGLIRRGLPPRFSRRCPWSGRWCARAARSPCYLVLSDFWVDTEWMHLW